MTLPRLFFSMIFLSSLVAYAQDLRPDDVLVIGALDYGQTSETVDYSGTPPYAAFVFNGNSGDRIEVTLRGADQKGELKITTGSLKELASGTGHISFTLPDSGPDLGTYYIVFRHSEGKAARFTVQLAKAAVNQRVVQPRRD